MHWLTKRVLRLIANFGAVVTISFFLIKALPGSTASYMRIQMKRAGYSDAQIARRIDLYTTFDTDASAFEQFTQYVGSLLQGDMGQTIHGSSVAEQLLSALPWTVFVMGVSLILTYVIGLILGAALAYIEGSRTDSTISVLSITVGSIPYYLGGILMLFIFAYGIPFDTFAHFPTGRRYSGAASPGFNAGFLLSVLHHATLPIVSMTIPGAGGVAIGMRANSISELGSDYMRVGRLRGLSPRRLSTWYLGRNAILPMFTTLFVSIATVFGGSVIMEEIFAYPGVGLEIFEAVEMRDAFMMMGGFILLSGITLTSIFIADITYGYVDPRIGHGAQVDRNIGNRSLRGWIHEGRIKLAAMGDSLFGGSSFDAEAKQNRVGELPDRLQAKEQVPMSRTEQVKQRLDKSVVAPLKIILSDKRGIFGTVVIAGYLLMGTVGVWLTKPASLSQVPDEVYLSESSEFAGATIANPPPPFPFGTLDYPLGVTPQGQDLMSAIVHATPNMLVIVGVGATVATGLAVVIGTVSGFLANTFVDKVLMFVTDTVMTIPGIVLLIVLAAVFEPSDPWAVGLILSIDAWPPLARALRSEVLSVREESYVEASNIIGLSQRSIVIGDIIPNLMPYITINFIVGARGMIFSSVALYFLGVLPFSEPNWGIILNNAWNSAAVYSTNSVHWIMVPTLVIALFTVALTMLSQAMDRVFNPQTRARHVSTTDAESSEPEPEDSGPTQATATDI